MSFALAVSLEIKSQKAEKINITLFSGELARARGGQPLYVVPNSQRLIW